MGSSSDSTVLSPLGLGNGELFFDLDFIRYSSGNLNSSWPPPGDFSFRFWYFTGDFGVGDFEDGLIMSVLAILAGVVGLLVVFRVGMVSDFSGYQIYEVLR